MYQIKKRFKFEAAHILDAAYSKECKNIHGHSYVADIFFNRIDLNPDMMVMDFKILKEEISPIINLFDHALILSQHYFNTHVMEDFKNFNIVKLEESPTAEYMAFFLFNRIQKIQFSPEIKLNCVRLWETKNNYAEYYETLSDNLCTCCNQ